MLDSLYIGATGMHAQQQNIDIVANNLANVNTAGFKKNRVEFEDLLYRNVARATAAGETETVYRLGVGTAISGTEKVFTVGDMKRTDAPLDLAIRGPGFFQVTLADGTTGYTRNGAFKVNSDGTLITADGHALFPVIQVPPDATSILVEPDGRVLAMVPNDTRPIEMGKIELANFLNPGGLTPTGDNTYLQNARSGEPMLASPGENGVGQIAQGFLESSNVKLVEEMINLIMAQRAYELNAKVVQASDELLSMSNNLRR